MPVEDRSAYHGFRAETMREWNEAAGCCGLYGDRDDHKVSNGVTINPPEGATWNADTRQWERSLEARYVWLGPAVSSASDGFNDFSAAFTDVSYTVTPKEEKVIPLADVKAQLKTYLPSWVQPYVRKGYLNFRTTGNSSSLRKEVVKVGLAVFPVYDDAPDTRMSTYDFTDLMWDAERFNALYKSRLRDAWLEKRGIVVTTPKKPVKSGGGNYERFLSDRRANPHPDEVIPMFDLAPHGLVSSRKWGIEVETAGARNVKSVPAGWDAKYDGSLESAYSSNYDDNEPPQCELDHEDTRYNEDYDYRALTTYNGGTNDRTVENPDYVGYPDDECDVCRRHWDWDNGEGEFGEESNDTREFVSPILHSYHSKGLEALIEQIITDPQNDTAGIHVHVSVADLNSKQIGSLVYGYNVIEPLIESSYRRRTTREYCKPRRADEAIAIGRDAKAGKKRLRDIYSGDRYVSLNLCAISAHGTVEFRAHGGLEQNRQGQYEDVIKWAAFCREAVNCAKMGTSSAEWHRASKSFAELKKLFLRKGSETVDLSMSIITPDDITEMADTNSGMDVYVTEEDFASVGGEI